MRHWLAGAILLQKNSVPDLIYPDHVIPIFPMESDEESSKRSVGVQASYGVPQFIFSGAMFSGLDVDAENLPSLKTLLGKYAWVETGVEEPCGPQLEKGLTLRLEDPDAPVEFPNLHAEFSFMGEVGVFVAVRRSDESNKEDCTPCWEFDIEWKKSNEHGQLLKARLYVGTVLDDNGAPFLEIIFGDETDPCIPYGYAKRQPDEGDVIGLSEDEKKRLKFLTNAKYDALMDAKEAKERKPIEARIRQEIQEIQEREERERVGREKEERAREIQRKRDEQRQAQLAANKANGILTKKERKILEQEKRAAENRLRAETAPRTKKQRKAEQERLAREEAEHDLLKNPPHIVSTSSMVGHQAPTPVPQTPTMLPLQRWTEVKQEPADLKGFPSSIVKQEEMPSPALHREDHHGIKRSHPDDPEDKAFKRLKLEY